jgi:predicted AAA+ superfamily ATPase
LKGEASSTFFNRLTEQKDFIDNLNDEPSTITVLVGPQSCGKTVRSAFLCTILRNQVEQDRFFVQLFLKFYFYYFLFVAEIFTGACWPI